MIPRGLIKDHREQEALKNDAKHLIEEAMTTMIEMFQGKSLCMWTEEEILEANKIRKGKGQLFKERSDGKNIIEYTDAVGLLAFYTGDSFGKKIKNKIREQQKDKENFDYNKFKEEYDRHCQVEQNYIDLLRRERNEQHGHSIEASDMGEIYSWIRSFIKYLDFFSNYRTQELAEYDSSWGNDGNIKDIENYFRQASVLKFQ